MNPTPPPAPTNGVAILMAEIERIAQELRATNKRPLPATEEQVKALLERAERDRPVTVNVDSKAVATVLLGQVDQQAQAFQAGCDRLITLVDDRTDYLSEQLAARLAAVEAAEAKLRATAQRIPTQLPINWLANWPVTAVVALGPLVVVLLMLWFTGMFSRVPQAEMEEAREANKRLTREGVFYRDQVEAYRKKHPKSAADFPPYVPPTTPAPAAE